MFRGARRQGRRLQKNRRPGSGRRRRPPAQRELLFPSMSWPLCSAVGPPSAGGGSCLSPRPNLLAPLVEGNGTGGPATFLSQPRQRQRPCGAVLCARSSCAGRQTPPSLASSQAAGPPQKCPGSPHSVYRRVDDDAAGCAVTHSTNGLLVAPQRVDSTRQVDDMSGFVAASHSKATS